MPSLVVPVELVEVCPVGGLCQSCWLPGLVRVTFTIGNSISSVVRCTDCRADA